MISRDDVDAVVDACGLQCPMPLLKAKLALNALGAGDILQVLVTDPGSQRDFVVFAQQSGHILLESTQSDACFEYIFQKKLTG